MRARAFFAIRGGREVARDELEDGVERVDVDVGLPLERAHHATRADVDAEGAPEEREVVLRDCRGARFVEPLLERGEHLGLAVRRAVEAGDRAVVELGVPRVQTEPGRVLGMDPTSRSR